MLHDAERKGLVVRNVARLADAPSMAAARDGPRHERVDADELSRFLRYVENYRAGALVHLAAMTGMRRGIHKGRDADVQPHHRIVHALRTRCNCLYRRMRDDPLTETRRKRSGAHRSFRVATLRSWERLGTFLGPPASSTTMLLTRSDDHPIGGGPTDEVAMARLGAHDRTVIDLERAHGQILFGFVRRPRRQRRGRGRRSPGVSAPALRRARRGRTDPGLKSWTSMSRTAWRWTNIAGSSGASGWPMRTRRSSDETRSGADLERRQVWSEVDRLPERATRRALPAISRRSGVRGHRSDAWGSPPVAARSHCSQALAVLRDRLAGEDR